MRLDKEMIFHHLQETSPALFATLELFAYGTTKDFEGMQLPHYHFPI